MAFDRDFIDQLLPKMPGVIGSIGAVMWMQGTFKRKAAMILLGIAASEFGTADFVSVTGISEGLSGFLVGMCSMTFADWVFRGWAQFQLGPLLNEWSRKFLGLPPKQD